MSYPFIFILLCLASYRFTRLITDDGWPPSEWFRHKVVERFGPQSSWADYVHCHWCFGTWVSIAGAAIVHYWIIPLPLNWGMWAVAVACVVGLIGENLDG